MLIKNKQHETGRRKQRNARPNSNTWPHARAQETKEHVASRKAAAGWKGIAGGRDQHKLEEMETYPLRHQGVFVRDGAPSPRRSNNVTAARGGGRCNESRDVVGNKTLRGKTRWDVEGTGVLRGCGGRRVSQRRWVRTSGRSG